MESDVTWWGKVGGERREVAWCGGVSGDWCGVDSEKWSGMGV